MAENYKSSDVVDNALDDDPKKTVQQVVPGDSALAFLEDHEAVVFTKEEERAVVSKIDWRLMPLVSVCYSLLLMRSRFFVWTR